MGQRPHLAGAAYAAARSHCLGAGAGPQIGKSGRRSGGVGQRCPHQGHRLQPQGDKSTKDLD